MAFNQASFFLLPPRYGPVCKIDHAAKTASGEPLTIVSTEMVNSAAPKVIVGDLRQWLFDRGFKESERYGGSQILYRGRHTTPTGNEDEIDLSLPLSEDEIRGLRLRFLLTPHTPDRISEWKTLISELGNDFGFKLMDGNRSVLLPCIDFPVLLLQNEKFLRISKNLGWKF